MNLGNGSAGSSLHEDKPLNNNRETVLTPAISIINIIDQVPDDRDSLILKLNIEGAEYEVLDELIRHPECLSKVTELWLDFHGYLFKSKWEYLAKELYFVDTFKSLGIPCFDVDFMSGFYKGYDKYPPVKTEVKIEDLIGMYTS